jgi:hypothetical protein
MRCQRAAALPAPPMESLLSIRKSGSSVSGCAVATVRAGVQEGLTGSRSATTRIPRHAAGAGYIVPSGCDDYRRSINVLG